MSLPFFFAGGRLIPRGVETERITDQQVIGLDTSELRDLMIIYP
jgi:hypothetical protein